MAVAAVAHEIDDNILLELLPVIQRETGNEEGRFGIVAVDMEDGRLDHLGNIAAVLG